MRTLPGGLIIAYLYQTTPLCHNINLLFDSKLNIPKSETLKIFRFGCFNEYKAFVF